MEGLVVKFFACLGKPPKPLEKPPGELVTPRNSGNSRCLPTSFKRETRYFSNSYKAAAKPESDKSPLIISPIDGLLFSAVGRVIAAFLYTWHHHAPPPLQARRSHCAVCRLLPRHLLGYRVDMDYGVLAQHDRTSPVRLACHK